MNRKRQLPFDPNLISKIFFEFNEKNSRSVKFNKINEIIDIEKKYFNDSRMINEPNKKFFRDNLMSQIDYVYTETNRPQESQDIDSILIKQRLQFSKKIRDNIFSTELKKLSFTIPKMKKKKKREIVSDTLENKSIDYPTHKLIHSQIIPLKGKKNKTYKFKYNIPKGITFMNISSNKIQSSNADNLKKVDEYEMRLNALSMKKDVFKV